MLHLLDEIDGDAGLEPSLGYVLSGVPIDAEGPYDNGIGDAGGLSEQTNGEVELRWTATVDQTSKSWRCEPHAHGSLWQQGKILIAPGEEEHDGREPPLGSLENCTKSDGGEAEPAIGMSTAARSTTAIRSRHPTFRCSMSAPPPSSRMAGPNRYSGGSAERHRLETPIGHKRLPRRLSVAGFSRELMNDRRSTAYHEAGHAVVGRTLGVRCEEVTIGPEGDHSLGHSSMDDPRFSWERGDGPKRPIVEASILHFMSAPKPNV